ncbi:nifR3 family TIM-barrel protein [Desulfosoma caldarium]|uniref:tRNA-dihydrouridine synthase n=1 Tax=Desulfosoma caldarium TaxID=610254 RepID=A0A3N1UUP6_9BACT|nr:nifR3 family TIM-barrel protein [Desulfosoma caldarium]
MNLPIPWVMAPMADLTHACFRDLVAQWGGCGLYFTEMLNARIVASSRPEKDPYCAAGLKDRPRACQVVGDDPVVVAKAFEKLQALGRFDVFNFNLGCCRGMPARYGWGAALLQRPQRVREILREARRVLEGPFMVKMRIPEGPNETAQRWAELLHRCGVDAVVLHARYPRDLFKRPARWDVLKQWKRLLAIPLIGNGDVFSPQDGLRMMEETGCDGVMIGRAALMRPWIFSDLCHLRATGTLPDPPNVAHVVGQYGLLLRQRVPEREAVRRFRHFAFWICQNYSYGAYYYHKSCRASTLQAMVETLQGFVSRDSLPDYPVRPFMM